MNFSFDNFKYWKVFFFMVWFYKFKLNNFLGYINIKDNDDNDNWFVWDIIVFCDLYF